MSVAVISIDGKPLMPTGNGKARHLLKDGKAKIYKRNPFTIQLTYETTTYTQPIEVCLDTGYEHTGHSVKSESKEYVANQYDLLKNEKQMHDDLRKNKRNRRNRKRYRAPRFNNRVATKKEGWLAPSLKNKADRQIDIIKRDCSVMPIKDVYVELGQFDTQVLQAIEEGKPIPKGIDYQHGPTYGADTLREAVFQRDNHTCIFCGRSAIKDNAILHTHHVYYWKDHHGDRLDELATCCEKCHTSANHKKGGKLWGYDKKMKSFSGSAFMNSVRWYIYNTAKKELPDVNIHITYGAATKRSRIDLRLEKSHINDAYSMGVFRPSERADFEYYSKRRRNNRVLEKFYDAKYIDIRDNKKKSGKDLGCERTNRREPRNSEKNLRIYHGKKISKGRRTIRQKRYMIQSGSIVVYQNKKYKAKGLQNYGNYIVLEGLKKSVSVKKIKLIKQPQGWVKN